MSQNNRVITKRDGYLAVPDSASLYKGFVNVTAGPRLCSTLVFNKRGALDAPCLHAHALASKGGGQRGGRADKVYTRSCHTPLRKPELGGRQGMGRGRGQGRGKTIWR